MLTKYTELLKQICSIENDFEKITFLTPLARSILQLAAISSLEIFDKFMISDEIGVEGFLARFDSPSDGLPREILEVLVPLIRSDYDSEYLNGWFEANNGKSSLANQVLEWVEFRNGRPAHGVVGSTQAKEWADKQINLIKLMLVVFKKILPSEQNTLPNYSNLKLSLPFNKGPMVILGVKSKKGIWKVKWQSLNLVDASEFTEDLEVNNIFVKKTGSSIHSRSYKLEEVVTQQGEEIIYHNLPIRQTDIFEGRINEINKIQEWLSDGDVRTCLIYGDGGYGKTTLVLEALNQLIEGSLEITKNLPFIICFYSAKKTKWSENGLIYLRSVEPIIDDCIRELVRSQLNTISRDWFTTSSNALINKAQNILKENKITRDDVLLVIDNTETLATTMAESRALADSINKISKLLARVVVTSRRREEIAAEPIAITGLSEQESVALLKRLAKEYYAQPLIQAGESKLRKVSTQLMHKPLLITAFVKYLSYAKVSIDTAIEKYMTQSDEELLEFLYEDAWLRMTELQKNVFFILVNIDCPIDNNVVKRACQLIKIHISEFNQALDETHFSNIIDYGNNYTLEIESFAKRFFLKKFFEFDDAFRNEIIDNKKEVESYIKQKEEVEKDFRSDRVTEAFRSSTAKAAKIYFDKGEIDNAIVMYELAIQEDPLNSYLYDRFSWLLLNRTSKFNEALIYSKRAVELDSNNVDAIVGLALAHYRCGNIEEGDSCIDLSITKGRSKSFGLLRKTIVRFHEADKKSNVEEKMKLYSECENLLKSAETFNLRNHSYDAKTKEDILKYKELVLAKINKIKFRA